MLTLRRAEERGRANFGWLDSRHSFSFGSYFDDKHMGFGPLRVINDDRVAGGGGFPTHPHADMEIVSYVLEGALEHKDSLGTGSVDPSRRRAAHVGRHAASATRSSMRRRATRCTFCRSGSCPRSGASTPSYEQKTFAASDKRGKLRLVGSRDGRDGSVTIHQDVDLYATVLGDKDTVSARAEGRACRLGAGRARQRQAQRGTALSRRRRGYRAGRQAGAERHVGCRGARVRHGGLTQPSDDGPAAARRPALFTAIPIRRRS